ncbi:MAG: hypothetical protein ABI384_01255 [Allobranchiibius sp.]
MPSGFPRAGRWSLVMASLTLVVGCGSQTSPGATGTSPRTSTVAPPSSTSPLPGQPGGPDHSVTYDLAGAMTQVGRDSYSRSYALMSVDRSQTVLTLRVTDLADGAAIIARARAAQPGYAGVSVHLIKVPYSEKELLAAQNRLTDRDWKKYRLVGTGPDSGQYLSVRTDDPQLKDPVSGRAGRHLMERTLSRIVGVRVVVTYSVPSGPAATA